MKQTADDLQQDYLGAMEAVANHMAAASPARTAEFFLKFANDLRSESGLEFDELRVIALLNLSRAQERLQQTQDSRLTRREAITMLDRIGEPSNKLNIQDRLADVLVEFGEYRRAIRHCEQAIKLSGTSGGKLANRLWRAGRTYLRAGFKEHAEEPLRQALQFFNATSGDPRTPVILNDLGNALRQSSPEEAEKSYQEAAIIWENKGALAQATTAWVNLGILCAEQGRLEESLGWYEKARRVRQADPSTPRARLGSLSNNIANLYRRMKNFEQAVREVEDAIELLEGSPVLADAYGTRGLILRDQSEDENALDWFRKSSAEHARHPSLNVSQLIEVLANEAAALGRLGRDDEAHEVEQQLARIQRDVPVFHKHEIAPAVKLEKDAEKAMGEVLIELDGIHLPESVYRTCDINTLENRLEEALETNERGELDGHESGPETTTVFLYGADAEALFRAVEPVLRDYPLCQGARVTIRQDTQERRVVLS